MYNSPAARYTFVYHQPPWGCISSRVCVHSPSPSHAYERKEKMFLTKKGLLKILMVAIIYFVVGSLCLALGAFIASLGVNGKFLFVLGAVCYALSPLLALWGRYAEGKGILINTGNKYVRNELKPYEFIKEYQSLKSSTELVINKPSVEVLQLVAMAYDAVDDRENCLLTMDEMIAVASEKKKTFAKLIKCSFLFSYDKIDEAEAIFTEARAAKQDLLCQTITDIVLKSDRAMAMKDYKTVEAYLLKALSQTVPKLDPLSKLTLHYKLGEVYENLQDCANALTHYQYCAEHGGETAIKASAVAALERLQ